MAKYINPFTDMGFKRIFGQEFSKPLLLDFLNNLLYGERIIQDLRFLDKEQTALYEGDRTIIYDIYCTTNNGEHIIVEMQNRDQPNFKKRSIYYISEAISRQGKRGADWRYDIKAVYLIAFLNFELNDIGPNFRTDVALMDMETRKVFSTDLRMIFLQLPMFKKKPEECDNDFDRWISVLKNMEALTRLPWAVNKSVFERIAEIADISALSKEERIKYEKAIKQYRDTLCVMEGAEQKGERKGERKGEQRARAEISKKLFERGMAIEEIALITSLTEEEVRSALAES